MVSFAVQKLVILIRFHWFILAFISDALGDCPEKTFGRLISENVLCMFSSRSWWCLVLYLSLQAILGVFLCVVWGCVPVWLICMQLSRFPSNACWKGCLVPILSSCLLCQGLIDRRCLGLFLGSLFCSIGLPVCCGTSTTPSWWLWLVMLPEVWESDASCLVFVPQDCLGNSGSFVVPYKCLDSLF